MIHPETLAEWERVCGQATEGPWRVSMTGYSVKSNSDAMPIVAQNPWGTAMKERQAEAWLSNAELIAISSTVLPELLTAVREQQNAHDEFTARLNRAVDAGNLNAVAEIVAEMELF